MDHLIKIKNKIPPKTEAEEVNKNNNKLNIVSEGETQEKEEPKIKIAEMIKEKSRTLKFFIDLITNLENIHEYKKVLRIKGSSLPVKITIQVIKYERY